MAEPLLSKSQIQQLISSPTLAARWFILWLCSVVFLLCMGLGVVFAADSFNLPGLIIFTALPALISVCLARMTWNPTAKLRWFGEVCSAVILVLSAVVAILGYAASSQPFSFMGGGLVLLGLGGMVLGATLLCLVRIACVGVPRHVRGKNI